MSGQNLPQDVLRDKVVYLHRRATDGVVFYIGMGSHRRARAGYTRSPQWHAVADMCGFSVEIVADGLTMTEALTREIEEIAKYDLRTLANQNTGGGGCQRHTEATRRKLSENCSMKRPEVAKKVADQMRGRKRPGLKISPAALDALRRAQQARIGTKHSAETLAKMSVSQKGRRKTADQAKKISETKRDKTLYRFWHPDRGEKIMTRKEAVLFCGISVSGVSQLVRGKRAAAFDWRCHGPASLT